MTGALDGKCQLALVPGAGADFATGANLAPVRNIAAQLIAVLVINNLVLVFAIDADSAHRGTETALSVPSTLASAAAIVARTARTTARAAA